GPSCLAAPAVNAVGALWRWLGGIGMARPLGVGGRPGEISCTGSSGRSAMSHSLVSKASGPSRLLKGQGAGALGEVEASVTPSHPSERGRLSKKSSAEHAFVELLGRAAAAAANVEVDEVAGRAPRLDADSAQWRNARMGCMASSVLCGAGTQRQESKW